MPACVLQNIDQFDDVGPCVIMASPGMMQSGLSRQLFEAWCTDKRNGLVVAGYCVEGTLAKVRMFQGCYGVTLTKILITACLIRAFRDYDIYRTETAPQDVSRSAGLLILKLHYRC